MIAEKLRRLTAADLAARLGFDGWEPHEATRAVERFWGQSPLETSLLKDCRRAYRRGKRHREEKDKGGRGL
jgi:hypothetical protein